MNPISILIVEDEDDLREILVEEIEVRGWSVQQADNGPAAFELLMKNDFAIVISDIRMPGFGGVDLVKKLRALEAAGERSAAAMPDFIFITGFSDFSEEEVRAMGAKAVFQKPFRIREMIACVEQLLGQLAKARGA